jgi:ribose 5-phosphate isomerase A
MNLACRATTVGTMSVSRAVFSPYDRLEWPTSISNRVGKEAVAREMAHRIESGQVIGVGSGSTSFLTLLALAQRVRQERLEIIAVPSSLEMQWYCQAAGFKISDTTQIDVAFDGADEVDGRRRLIKGRGGALLRERRNFNAADRIFILVDSTKNVSRLGTNFPVPVELDPSAAPYVARELGRRGFDFGIRLAGKSKDGPVITESGSVLIDVWLAGRDSEDFDSEVRGLEGVRDTGLFLGYDLSIIASS